MKVGYDGLRPADSLYGEDGGRSWWADPQPVRRGYGATIV